MPGFNKRSKTPSYCYVFCPWKESICNCGGHQNETFIIWGHKLIVPSVWLPRWIVNFSSSSSGQIIQASLCFKRGCTICLCYQLGDIYLPHGMAKEWL